MNTDFKNLLINPNSDSANATLRHFYSSNNYGADDMELCLTDGSSYHVTSNDLFTALQILTSEWFSELVEAHNKYELYYEETSNAYAACIDTPAEDAIYNLYHAAKLQGEYRARKEMYKQRIIDRVTLYKWTTTLKVYETLYQIPRERV